MKIKIASRIVDLFNRKIVPGRGRAVRSRYDAAGTSADSQKHWAYADSSSADAEANSSVRQRLRDRARYEVANNSYAKGIVLTIANNTIGTGPRLQCLTDDETVNSKVEEDFCQWAQTVDLAGKLRTVRQVRCVDGEAFILLVQNPKLKDANVRLTNENLMELVTQRKDKERQEEEEVTEELKRATMPEMAKELSLFDEALLVFENHS